jgi:hypothetical protein
VLTTTVEHAARRVASLLMRLTVVLLAAAVVLSLGLTRGGDEAAADRGPHVDLTQLTAATTDTHLPRAPRDHGTGPTGGEVVHPRRAVAVFAEPGRRPFAKVGPRQLGPTWLPVVSRHAGWSKVLLPSRPNGAAGWVRTALVERRTTPYVVRVHLASRTLELVRDGATAGTWRVAVGAPATPTPTGRTFLLGSVVDDQQTFSPVILPLGAHSDTLDTYGGGPGTVAFHGWPDSSVFGQAVSHGCVRVPADALDLLRQVPLGTLVLVDDR